MANCFVARFICSECGGPLDVRVARFDLPQDQQVPIHKEQGVPTGMGVADQVFCVSTCVCVSNRVDEGLKQAANKLAAVANELAAAVMKI